MCFVSIKETHMCLSNLLLHWSPSILGESYWKLVLGRLWKGTGCFLPLLWILSPKLLYSSQFWMCPEACTASPRVRREQRERWQAGTITLQLSGSPFLLSASEMADSVWEGLTMSPEERSPGSRETWVLVLALSLPYECRVFSLGLPFHICQVRDLDLIILKSCALQHAKTKWRASGIW